MAESDELLGRIVGGRFRVVSLLGEGGMAKVYVAEQEAEPKRIALKIMNPSLTSDRAFVKRFEREANAASRVKHVGSVRILACGVADGLSYIAMELLEGEDLFTILAREGRLGQQRAARVVREIAEALAAAHELGIVHRDLKPENVMIVPDTARPEGERVKVLDFGIAKLMAPEESVLDPRAEPSPSTGITMGHTLVGTPAYMSPEQAAMDRVDGRADVYACGVLLFQLVTGKVPFAGETPLHVAQKHLREAVPVPSERVPGIDASLEKVIVKALQKKPADRYPTATMLARALADILARLPREPASATKKRPSTPGEAVLAPPRPSAQPSSPPALGTKRPPPRPAPDREPGTTTLAPATKPFGTPAPPVPSAIKQTMRGTGIPPREPPPPPASEDDIAVEHAPTPVAMRAPSDAPTMTRESDPTGDDTPTSVQEGSDNDDRAQTLVRHVPPDPPPPPPDPPKAEPAPRLGPQGTAVMELTAAEIAALAPPAELVDDMRRPPPRAQVDRVQAPTLLSAGASGPRHVVAVADAQQITGEEATRPSTDFLIDRRGLPSLDEPTSKPSAPSTQGSVHVIVPPTGPSPPVADLPRVVLSPTLPMSGSSSSSPTPARAPAPPPPRDSSPSNVGPMPPPGAIPPAASGTGRGPRTLELRQKPPVLEPFPLARPSMSAKRGLLVGFSSGVVVALVAFLVYWFVLRPR